METFVMLPQPLHPAIVHFPIAFAVILPATIAWGLFQARRESGFLSSWLPSLAIAILLAATATIAVETGEDQEDRVEPFVVEEILHDHEEAGEMLQRVAITLAIVLGIAVIPALPSQLALVLQISTLVASLALLPLLWRAGHSGGELVYTHGAAQAYVQGASAPPNQAGSDHDD